MNNNKDIILVGGFHEIIELCEICNKKIIGIIDNKLKNQYLGYRILGNDKMVSYLYKEFSNIPIVVTPDIPEVRKKLFEYYSNIGFKFCNLIHPKANISKYANIGEGVVIQNGVNISANVFVEDFVKINIYANVMHDSQIGKYTTIAPNAVILGRVKISQLCYIGSNSTLLPELNIGKNSVIGAGAVVTKDVGSKITVIGNPARTIKRKEDE